MVCFLMSENIVSLSRREQGAGERLYVNERLMTLKTRLNLTRPSNTLVWMVAEAAIPRIGVWCTSAINVEARNLPAPADFVSIFLHLCPYVGAGKVISEGNCRHPIVKKTLATKHRS